VYDLNERADSETKQAIKEGRDSQLLLLLLLLLPVADLKTQWKKKGKEVSVKTPNGL
jgi:hypothetical protein